jgi:hypothetical protein
MLHDTAVAITAVSELAEMDCGPGDHPRETDSRPKHGLNSLAAAVWLRVASEEKPGAEMVHTRRLANAQGGGGVNKP